MATRRIMTALSRPRRGVEGRLLEDVRLLLVEPGKPLTARSLHVILNRILSLSRSEARLHRSGKYMSEVLERWPRWHRRVATLRSETIDSWSSVDRRIVCMLQTLPRSGVVGELPSFVQQWMQAHAGIRRRESSLLQEALTFDLGGEA